MVGYWGSCKLWFLFGVGTQLTVLAGEVKAPSFFIYRPSEDELKTDKATIVFTMSDFTHRTVNPDGPRLWTLHSCKVTHQGKEIIQTVKRSECFS
ncbi:immunoglobulin lambda-like polypeptide 5 [Rhinoderma darwinii]|uniref:immunoglobulin lambda-like polypeptide 5 n=1 Tax=Rhinoderma darwinii TaxID=43563 RepID=UPI003F67EA97